MSEPFPSNVSRRLETKAWCELWTKNKESHDENRVNRLEHSEISERKSSGFKYLYRIFEATHDEVILHAILHIDALGLSETDWDKKISTVRHIEFGTDRDLAFGPMQQLIQEQGCSISRAAEKTVAELGLFLRANSWQAAIQQARQLWQDYLDGNFIPLKDTEHADEMLVQITHPTGFLHPETALPLPSEPFWVRDTVFWRGVIRLGVVKPVFDKPD